MVKENQKPEESGRECLDAGKELILYNDDVNTFEYVIESLIEVCRHDNFQAEQCALIAHYNGKCPVLSGLPEDLKPSCDELGRRGLTVAIE